MQLGLSLSVCPVIRHFDPFSPLPLNPALWIDPSDLNTMFQDLAGTIPVASHSESVAVIFDKSQELELGPELILEQDIGAAPWNVTGTVEAGNVLSVEEGFGKASYPIGSVEREFFALSIDVEILSGDESWSVFTRPLGGGYDAEYELPHHNNINGSGRQTVVVPIATNSVGTQSLYIQQRNTPAHVSALKIYSISAKKILGNHLSATSATARPAYQTDGSRHWLQFDGVNNELSTAKPLPFSEAVFNVAAFRCDNETGSPVIIQNAGEGSGTDKRQPMVFMTPDAGEGRLHIGWGTVDAHMDPTGGIEGVDFVSTTYVSGTSQVLNLNGDVQETNRFETLTPSSDPFQISPVGSGTRFEGRLYGVLQTNEIPADSQVTGVRAYYVGKSGGVL